MLSLHLLYSPATGEDPSAVPYIAIGVALLLIIGGVVLTVLQKKKK